MTQSSFGDLVRARRRARGLTIDDLAARLDCDASTVRRWERGAALPGPRHMASLRVALGIPLDELERACIAALVPGRPQLAVEGAGHMMRTGKNWESFAKEIIALELRNYDISDARDEGTAEQWVPILRMVPDSWRVLADGDAIVGAWHVVPLTDAAAERVADGGLRDGEITLDDVEPLAFPGLYNGYLGSFVLDAPYRYGAPFQLLFDSLAEQIARYAANGVFFRDVLTAGFTPHGVRLCERLQFKRISAYAGDPARPIFHAPVRTLVARPEFQRFEALRRFYEGD